MTDKKQTYLDEFFALNGTVGYDYLLELKLTGDRAKDKALVQEAIAANARIAQLPDAGLITERGFIGTNLTEAEREHAKANFKAVTESFENEAKA